MNLDQARKIIEAAINKSIVPMLLGGPGIGKSDLISQISKDKNCWLDDVRLAQYEPTDVRGIPYANHSTKRMEWYPPSSLPTSDENGKCTNGPGIIFFDEIDKATVAVKNAALQIVLNRMVGSYKLPSDVAIICAGNREEDNCFSTPLGAALSNRMIHVEIEEDFDVWRKWALKNKIEDDIIGFLQFRPKLLYDNNGHAAFPSPRSWAMASTMIKGVGDEQMVKRLIAASVGEGVVGEFVAYSTVYKNVDTEAIITHGKLPEIKKDNPSFNYAVTTAVAVHVRNKNMKKYHANIVKFLNHINPELRVVFFRQQLPQTISAFANDSQFTDIITNVMSSFDI